MTPHPIVSMPTDTLLKRQAPVHDTLLKRQVLKLTLSHLKRGCQFRQPAVAINGDTPIAEDY